MSLTRKEEEVLKHLYTSKSQQEIADSMGRSLSMVKLHCNKIYAKMGVKDRVELMGNKILELELRSKEY